MTYKKEKFMEIDIDRDAVTKYTTQKYLLFGLFLYGIGIIISIIAISRGIPRRATDLFKYWVEDDCVRITRAYGSRSS